MHRKFIVTFIYCKSLSWWLKSIISGELGNGLSESDAEETPWLPSHRLSCRTGEEAGVDVGGCYLSQNSFQDLFQTPWQCSHTFSKCCLYLQPLVLTHQCQASFKEGEMMMWIVRNSAPAPLLRRHQCLFSQGKPCMETWSVWSLCCASGLISAIVLVGGATVLWTGQLKMEMSVSFAHCQAADTWVLGKWSHHSMRAECRWESWTVLAWLQSEAVSPLTQFSQLLKCVKHLNALYLLQKSDTLCIP